MARKVIDTGIIGNDGTGDSIRDSFRKVNENFRELYGALGLGETLKFTSLDGGPGEFTGKANAVVAVNPTASSTMFKQIVAGSGISVDFDSNSNEIQIINTRSSISADDAPALGGDLNVQSGGITHRIYGMNELPTSADQAVNKAYADSKIARAGVQAVDPATGKINSSLGTMTGPLVLSRDPKPEDDVTYGGLIAATKRYVDNAGFGSSVNLHVAMSGNDARAGVGSSLQGRALSYAYRTLEAALKKAEEIIKSARPEIGPYKKTLTWTNPLDGAVSECSLTDIETSPDDGSGFAGRVKMTIDTISLSLGGFNYQVGEILKINVVGGDAANAATLEILTIASEPGAPNGPILTFRLLTGGLFDGSLPGTSIVVTEGSTYGASATFNVTYKVSSAVIETPGSNYSLVSVRVSGGGGSGAFGFADVSGGAIAGITITDGGSGFTSIPSLIVNLPRFAIYTGGFRTDFSGDYSTDSAIAKRGRDIRAGLYLRGETSGALAQILSHNGELDTAGNELFDVDIKYGVFQLGESIAYGDVANSAQVVVFVESGIYYENLPLKVPQNVSVLGDDFRRSVIRPKPGLSSSPWAFVKFRRDRIVDGLNTARNEYNAALTELNAYHYLQRADAPVYPAINNKGYYRSASDLLRLNKTFIQEEVIAWTNKQIVENSFPFDENFEYNEDLCKRDVGLIIDAMVFDLYWGGADRTISAALKYRESASALKAITDQLSQTEASIKRINTVAQSVIKNLAVTPSTYTDPITNFLIEYSEPQIIDTAYTAETGAGGVRITVSAATNATICTITTSSPHGLSTGDVVTFESMVGMTELNNKSYWVEVATSTQFNIYSDQARNYGVNSTNFGEYTASSGDMIPNGGVITLLINVILDIISNSGAVNYPLDNDKMDMFLMNDATQLRRLTLQGGGGFAMVLDPTGQILAKSPYAQEGAVFSKSNGRHQFNGGMYVDGFAGNLKFKILNKISNTRLQVGQLVRFPQLPASFIVEDQVYRINYVRDYTYNTAGSTGTLVLDDATPWPYPVFTYNADICDRDVGLIIDGVGYDIVFGSNYWSRKAALSYRQANAHVVVDDQLDLTVRAIDRAHDNADAVLAALTPTSNYSSARATLSQSKLNLRNIIRRGTTAAPALTLPSPPGLAAKYANAKTLLLANLDYIKDETIGYIEATYPYYNREKCYRDVGLILEAVLRDLVFGTNYYSTYAGLSYYRNLVSSAYVISNQKAATIAGINKARDLANALITDSGIQTLITNNFAIVTTIINSGTGSAPSLSYPVPAGVDSGISNAVALLTSNKAFIQAEIIAWINVQKTGNISPFTSSYSYDSAKCSRDVGYLVDAFRFDLLYGGTTATIDAGNTYFYGTTVISGQTAQTIAAYNRLSSIVQDIVRNVSIVKSAGNAASQTSGTAGSLAAANLLAGYITSINSIIGGGIITATDPTYSLGTTSYATARTTILAGKADVQLGTVDWLQSSNTTFYYDRIKCARDVGYMVEAIAYDITYGGNSQSWDAARRYYDGVGDAITSQLPSDQNNETIGAVTYVKYLIGRVIQSLSPATTYSSTSQYKDLSNSSDSATAAETGLLMDNIIGVLTSGYSYYTTNANIVLPNLGSYAYDSAKVNARSTLQTSKTAIQADVRTWVDDNSNLFEILMPGNRSMLSNDFTQINDMGYGVVVTNGGLTECVSMFTYYCYTSYYSINGGQVRGVAGSSAHGVYALAAEGSDPLEVPTPVDLYYELSQGATVYNDGGNYNNVKGGLIIYVSNYEYEPRDFSEIEIDHGGIIGMVRYPVVTATIEDSFPAATPGSGGSDSSQKICRLSLSSDVATGLAAIVPDGTDVTLRMNTQIMLTGDVVGVAVRPSTALKLNETFTTNLYRVLSFADYNPPSTEILTCTFTTITDTLVSTTTPHGLLPGYIVKFSTTGSLPNGLIAGDKYWLLDDGFTETTFKVAYTKTGSAITVTSAGAGTFFFETTGLAKTTLREGYDYIESTVYFKQPFVTYGDSLQATAGSFVIGRSYTITSPGSTTFTSIGAANNNAGTTFTATGVGSGSGTVIVNNCTFSTTQLNATAMTAGQGYKILALGSTTNAQWIAAGDSVTSAGVAITTAAVGDIFTASAAAGGGNGTVLYSIVTRNNHGLSNGDIIRFESTGQVPNGLFTSRQYFVINKTTNTFQLGEFPGSTYPVTWTTDNSGAGTGYHGYGTVIGRAGDTNFAIVELGTVDATRVAGTKFNFKGQNYTIVSYDSPTVTGQLYGRIYLDRPLQDNINNFSSSITILAGVAARTEGSSGTLTIRIALTRVTGHDLLEIGTGSYADTNYPNEIYGSPVRIATETLLDTTGNVEYAQVVERGEGRCFFVTTDQFGNFSVGPFFRVDQGTGTVTFSASLALSNLSGLGFKRGVPIAEFSTDTSMSDNATDSVPVENAVRTYIDRRLGVTHNGDNTEEARLIPITTGGFMSLTGQLGMKGNMSLGGYKITNVADPVSPTDAVNLRSVKFDQIIGNSFPGQATEAGYMIAFTGTGAEGRAVKVDGDVTIPGDNAITTGLDSTQNILNIYVKDNIIDNANINSAAAIAQSKLAMNAATTRANATGITQADRGLVSLDSAQFTATNGWITITDNGLALSKLAQIASNTVLGNSTVSTGNSTAVPFSTVVDTGLGVKKSQYGQFGNPTGFLRRTGTLTSSQDTDFTTVEAISSYTGSVDTNANSRLVIRDSSGDFGGRNISASVQMNVGTKKFVDTSTTATGGSINFYGFTANQGITIAGGSLSTDKVNTYQNDNHLFKNFDNSGYAPIQVSQITTGTVTTGGASTAGTLTGNWSMATTSNLTLGTGTIDASTGTLKSTTLTTGASGTAGTLTGYWSTGAGSVINLDAGTLRSTTLSTGASGNAGTITGNWALSSSSRINFSSGTLQTTTLSTGASGTAGQITGTWTLTSGSSIDIGSGSLATTGLTSGGVSTAGTVTGQWALSAGSLWDTTAGTLKTTTLTTGAAGTAGTITGNWGMNTTSNLTLGTGTIDTTAGTLKTLMLNTGATGTAGTVTGAWTLNSGSTFVASSITSQANSATITAASTNTANQIVLRDASGNFSAGTITATLNGNALTSSSTTGNAATVTNGVYTTGSYSDPTWLTISKSKVGLGNVDNTADANKSVNYATSAGSITSQANSATITATSSNVANQIVLRDGSGNFSANIMTGTATAARYADLAERYAADKEYAPGTVVVFGGDKEITTSNVKGDTRVAGVITTNPAHLMNSEAGDDTTHPGVALQGRVPCRVVGKIRKGDILVCSGIHGVAIAGGDNIKVGSMIGKALEDYDSDHIGTIEVVVGRT